MWTPSFRCLLGTDGEREYRVGHELVDEFLEFVSGRARPNTVRAYAHDLKVFFSVVGKEPVEVTPADVLAFVTEQNRSRDGADNVVRISDGRAGMSASTIKRRLAAVSSLYGYLVTRGGTGVSANPVPRGLPTRKSRHRGGRGLPLVRGVRRLPRILEPGEVEALMGSLRTTRDRAMVPQVGGDRAEPKTAAGRRTVPLPGLIAELLDQHLSRYGLAGEADALVFSAPRGGRLHAANWHKRAWLPARRAAGWPTLRFHDLRHSAVPLWIAMGANLLQVSRWLGHSTVQITADVYGHLFPETNDLVIGRLDKALRASLPQPTDATATVDDATATTLVRRLRPGT
jgi:integrase